MCFLLLLSASLHKNQYLLAKQKSERGLHSLTGTERKVGNAFQKRLQERICRKTFVSRSVCLSAQTLALLRIFSASCIFQSLSPDFSRCQNAATESWIYIAPKVRPVFFSSSTLKSCSRPLPLNCKKGKYNFRMITLLFNQSVRSKARKLNSFYLVTSF